MEPLPATRYTKAGSTHLAYQVVGEGPLDLVTVESWVHHVEWFWDVAELARQRRRLAALGRLIIWDRPGTGLSDPVPLEDLPDLDAQMENICAVMDAAGSERAAVIGFTDGGQLAALFAAAHPERCRALVLVNATARMAAADDYPMGAPEAFLLDLVRRQSDAWAEAAPDFMREMAPSRVDDTRFLDHLARLSRSAVSPGAVEHYYRQAVLSDVRSVLPSISVPTLVIGRADGVIAPAGLSRYVADHIPGARYVEVPGTDHIWFTDHADEIVGEIEEFLTGARASADPDRRLATVLFTDIVGSTEQAATLGDARWRALLDAHDAAVRRELGRFGGQEIGTTGDGFLSTFDGPGQAIRCARAIGEALRPLDLHIRAGVHTGEVEVRGSQIGGLAVHIGARVAARAGSGEILASGTVRDLMAGSDLVFVDRGEHELKGVPGTWRLYSTSP